MGQVDADLVGAAGFQPAFDQGGEGALRGSEFLQHLIAGARRLAAAAQHRHALAVERAAADLAFDAARWPSRGLPHTRAL